MIENLARSRAILPTRSLCSAIVLLSCVSFLFGGCSIRKRPSVPWATAVQVRPAVQPRPATVSAVSEDPVPELRLELPPFPPRLFYVRSMPPRPRAGVAPANGGNETEKLEAPAPVIATQLTPQETSVAQQQTNQSLKVAEKNLQSARGKNLNAAQSDLVSKIKGFIKDAREAAQAGDWSRARSLAKKAQVLSEELVGSL